jgi:ketosteroid isomerase-like protein
MSVKEDIIALEREALNRWCRGDPSGFLEIGGQGVSYFDPFQPKRVDGLDNLTAYYEGLRGQISAARWEMIEPCVEVMGEAAVLTFNFVSYSGNEEQRMRWNCTEVYRRQDRGWRIIHTHWSFTQDGR